MNPGSSYTPGREIARGGMGAILEAKDQALDREVAMKVMLGEDEGSSNARQRFVREALVLARLEHPNIVPIHEMGRNAEGQLFYTMKMVKGRTLQAILDAIKQGDTATTQHYTLDRLLTIYRKVSDAVAFAHHHRIIHRDLKPENVMVGEFGEVLVMDWGLAKHLDDEQHAKTEAERAQAIEGFQELSDAEMAAGESGLTMDGSVMGSPQYMPPEQAEGRLADIGTHSDIYSLGGVLYAILTLRPPVEGRKVAEVLDNVKSGNITPPTHHSASRSGKVKVTGGEVADASEAVGLPHCPDGKVPASLSAVTMRAMAFQPTDRYADVLQIVADVEAYQGGFATRAENASALTLVRLFIQRHKALTVAAALVVLVTVGFLGKVVSSERKATANALDAAANEAKATATLDDLRRTAPVFYTQAQVDFQDGKLAMALEKLGYAIQLDGTNADYHLYRGHLQQSSQALSPAANDYRRVLALRPTDASAKVNLALCEKLLRESGGAAPNRAQQRQLLIALREQKREFEAAPLAKLFAPDDAAARNAILTRLREDRKDMHWPDHMVRELPDGTFAIEFGGTKMTNFSVLRGLPVTELHFFGSPLTDFGGLAGLPLTQLTIANTRVSDLTPLKGMKLKALNLGGTEVSDLSPLAGMPLESLRLPFTRVRDLTPLAGAPLTELVCNARAITSIAPLAGAPLKRLVLHDTSVTDLRPLRQSAQLEYLALTGNPVVDLGPVAHMPLKYLFLNDTKVTDLRPLAGRTMLEQIAIPRELKDLTTLRQLSGLKRISAEIRGHLEYLLLDHRNAAMPSQTAAEFWGEYDAKAKAAPTKK